MLVQKLRGDDLQSDQAYFDGIMVYAQNKVQPLFSLLSPAATPTSLDLHISPIFIADFSNSYKEHESKCGNNTVNRIY